jgi:hypothetical protein
MFAREFPVINIAALSSVLLPSELDVVKEIVGKDGRLRHSKPAKASGIGKYVWRMVAFCASPEPRHSCMPVMAFCDLPGKYGSDEYKAAEAKANRIEALVCASIRREEWYGVRRWGRALGC